MSRKYSGPELRAMYWGKPVPSHLVHGPQTNAARFWGCDCSKCLPSGRRLRDRHGMTHAERQRKLREAKKGKPIPPGTKHGIYAYRTYGCRCPICRAARSTAVHRVRNPWMYRTDLRGRWRERMGTDGKYDVLCWPPAGAGPDWRCECEQAV